MDALLRQRDLMEIMHVSRATLWRMLRYQDFPKPVVLMGCKRWRHEDFESWLEARKKA
ncbi:MAG: helix-turn-helix transcriptional regulator [Desulfuromonadaceae bacterium]